MRRCPARLSGTSPLRAGIATKQTRPTTISPRRRSTTLCIAVLACAARPRHRLDCRPLRLGAPRFYPTTPLRPRVVIFGFPPQLPVKPLVLARPYFPPSSRNILFCNHPPAPHHRV